MNRVNRRKKRTANTFIIIIFLISASIIIGLTYDFVCRKLEERRYPLRYTDYVEFYSAEYEIPKEIIFAVIKTESSYQYDAVSSKGAVGLMQIMPDTFDWLLTKTGEDLSQSELYDPKTNIKYGTYLLSILYKELAIWDHVYAAYNAGIGNVRNWLKNEEYTKNGLLVEVPFHETSKYIVKINEAKNMYNKLYFQIN